MNDFFQNVFFGEVAPHGQKRGFTQPPLGVPAEPEIVQRFPHPSTILASVAKLQCSCRNW